MNEEQYIKYVRIPVNDGRGCYLLTPEYFATCTIKQFRSVLKEIRYNKYLFSDQDINKLFYFIEQGINEQLNYLNAYTGYMSKKSSLKRKLEILNEERGTYYDVRR
jgi:hypothetical protein